MSTNSLKLKNFDVIFYACGYGRTCLKWKRAERFLKVFEEFSVEGLLHKRTELRIERYAKKEL